MAGACCCGPGRGDNGGLRVCLPSRGGGAIGPQSRIWASPSCWRVGVGLTGKVVSAPCVALRAAVRRRHVRLLMTPLFGPTFLSAAQY